MRLSIISRYFPAPAIISPFPASFKLCTADFPWLEYLKVSVFKSEKLSRKIAGESLTAIPAKR